MSNINVNDSITDAHLVSISGGDQAGSLVGAFVGSVVGVSSGGGLVGAVVSGIAAGISFSKAGDGLEDKLNER
jgi:outer membrane lipoprotein SlyB